MSDNYNNSIQKIIESVWTMYYQELNIEPMDVELQFTDNIYKKRLELAMNQKDYHNIKMQKDFISTLNGTIVLPKTINEKPYILISNNTINESLLFISTFTHELTHIHDFYSFAKYHNIIYLPNIETHDDFQSFYFWTEFHARRNGYYFYRKTMKEFANDNKTRNEEIQYIKEVECQFHLRYLVEDLTKYQNNPTQYMYTIIQFLGRFSIWQYLFPEAFNKNTLPETLLNTYKDKIIDLYNYLYVHSTFKDIKDNFKELIIKLESFATY